MADTMPIMVGERYRYRVPPKDPVRVIGADEYSVRVFGLNGRTEFSRSLFLDVFEPWTDD